MTVRIAVAIAAASLGLATLGLAGCGEVHVTVNPPTNLNTQARPLQPVPRIATPCVMTTMENGVPGTFLPNMYCGWTEDSSATGADLSWLCELAPQIEAADGDTSYYQYCTGGVP